ncbi:hypothetical protein LEP1GSC043_0650 [Leptospira weilii str. Ecochallenge]|uniref:Uncharacterized protein n=1 Tax=Leptospira weilii str. Ecochallenge TaxID=1049986 RepID=N1UEN0_9LEPT|nr:hypothetical protein LEP1GSC043_0650 [Leptospira weilii str. Ecochallenge]
MDHLTENSGFFSKETSTGNDYKQTHTKKSMARNGKTEYGFILF